MNDRKAILRYLFFDFLTAFLAWQLFNIFRFYEVRSTIYFSSLGAFLFNTKALLMSIGIPCFWLIVYFYFGYYSQPRLKNNGKELLSTLFSSLLGSLILFFTIIINDYPEEYTLFYSVFFGLFLIHFFCTLFFRIIQTTHMLNRHAKGLIGIPTIIIGTGKEAQRLCYHLKRSQNTTSFLLKGFIRAEEDMPLKIDPNEILGSLEELGSILRKQHIENIIVAVDNSSEKYIQQITNKLYDYGMDIYVSIHKRDLLFSNISLHSLASIPLIRITPMGMPAWQQNIKRTFDIALSFTLLLLLSPLFAYLSIRVRLDSKGPVFYTQERLGRKAKVFHILKFRTMYEDSEPAKPLLSSLNDTRITPFGRFMRKYRLDELPQLWNVLKGEMSLVGPRPERAYYAEQIKAMAPHYSLIYQVRPGITSLGMVKYGYADSVDKMLHRMEYDIIYLKNQSLLIDFKILIFTIKPLILGEGI